MPHRLAHALHAIIRSCYLVRVFGIHAVAEECAVEHIDVLPRGFGSVDGRHVPSADGRGA